MSLHLCLLGDADHVHLRRWAAEMLERDFRVSVVTARPETIPGVGQRVLSPVRRRSDWLFRVGEARRQVHALAPDIVHAHYVTSYGYLGARCAYRPLVLTAWGSDVLVTPKESVLFRKLTGWTLRQATLITADSADALEAIEALCPDAEFELLHWGADTERFCPSGAAVGPGFDIVSLRSWESNYRIDLIIAAIGELHRRVPDAGVRLHLLGGGTLAPDLRQQIDALGLADRIVMHGRLDEAEMIAVMQAAAVSVSVPTSDASSVSVLESMACGLPVVATRLPANEAWLGEQAELLIAPGDAQGLSTKLEELWREPERARSIGARNRERMLRDGARATQMDRMAALYHGLVRGPGREARP